MNLYLFGAGKRGVKIENLLFQHEVIINGFIDSFKVGESLNCGLGRTYKIISKNEFLKIINSTPPPTTPHTLYRSVNYSY